MGAQLIALGDPKYGGTWSFSTPLSTELQHALITQNLDLAQARLAHEAHKISSGAEEVLYAEVDVLFPCAVQNVITEGNVELLHARHVCEGANGPVSEAAREILHEHGVPLVPDFIANCGGAIAAFVELTSSSTNKVEEAKRLTRDKIAANVREMFALAQRCGAQPQQAGLVMALRKICG
jgi:glutamate dehydrogenase/leucine dehydrogenase